MPRLRRVTCAEPGYARVRRGRGFTYLDSDGDRLEDEETLARIRALGIPPAWRDVWICRHPNGHLQAVGTDAAGRRQYIYHERWRANRDREKFEHMLEFARALPRMRTRVEEHLSLDGMPRERVLACAVRLLDRGFFRVGSDEYAQENNTHGLTTIQRSHVRLVPPASMQFDYVAKAGKQRLQLVIDPAAFDVVEALKRRRGGTGRLLAWRDGRRWVEVRAEDVNAYLRDVTGVDCTAKDFRTWAATVLASVAVSVSPAGRDSKRSHKRAVARAVQEVAHYLGNTPAVCRASYIDPRVFDHYHAGSTIAPALARMPVADDEDEDQRPAIQGPVERAVLRMLAAST